MGSKVIPIRLDDNTLELVDHLIKLGVYSSRSEALRDFIRIGVNHMKLVKEVSDAVDKLFKLEENEGEIPLKLEGALRTLLGERGRF